MLPATWPTTRALVVIAGLLGAVAALEISRLACRVGNEWTNPVSAAAVGSIAAIACHLVGRDCWALLLVEKHQQHQQPKLSGSSAGAAAALWQHQSFGQMVAMSLPAQGVLLIGALMVLQASCCCWRSDRAELVGKLLRSE